MRHLKTVKRELKEKMAKIDELTEEFSQLRYELSDIAILGGADPIEHEYAPEEASVNAQEAHEWYTGWTRGAHCHLSMAVEKLED